VIISLSKENIMKQVSIVIGFCIVVLASAFTAGAAELSPAEQLGKLLFFDANLSTPPGQSCAECHDPAVGWTGPGSSINPAGAVKEGAVHTRFGNRKPPSSAYAGFNPILHRCGDTNCGCAMERGGMNGGGMAGGDGMADEGGMMCRDGFVGGLFWDGRATGWTHNDSLAEQATGPFLNFLEMNNPNPKLVCIKVRESAYADLFEGVWGQGTLDCVKDVDGSYERIARSIAAYERSAEVNPFSSKFDQFWQNWKQARTQGRQIPPVQNITMMNSVKFKGLGLSDMELMGLAIFNTKGRCSVCHLLQPMRTSEYPLFTDFQYHNIGSPKNPLNPFYTMPRKWNPDGEDWVDLGLGGFLEKTANMTDTAGTIRDYSQFAAENYGKHKTPTLRNVSKTSADVGKVFGHNGYFKSIMEIVHFYNCRDVPYAPQCTMLPPFPEPEVPQNVNITDMGNLGLTAQEGMSLIAFLKTLDDGFRP
jgi:cytochrome c peroxidase